VRRGSMHPFLDGSAPMALAHRGGDGAGTENTIAAFQDAVDLGFRVMETDLQVTADGVLVVFHDDALDRVTDARGPISAWTWADLHRVRVGGREPIARFDEVVASFPQVRWNVDVKSDACVARLIARLEAPGALIDRVCVGSFDDRRLAAVRAALGDRVCTSAGPRQVRALRIASYAGPGSRLLRLDADCVQIPEIHGSTRLVDGWLLAAAARAGLPVHVWTVNDPADMHRLLDLGVDGLVTDATRTLRDVFAERGVW
jgi:glycerophosphoryl diester phosphodiesterase